LADYDLIEFAWKRPRVGFQWVDAVDAETSQPGRYLVPGYYRAPIPFGVGKSDRRDEEAALVFAEEESHPLEEDPLLFYRFARLQPDEDSIRRFASRHGFLGLGTQACIRDRMREDAESLDDWRSEIEAIDAAFSIWDPLRRGDLAALEDALEEWHRPDSRGFTRFQMRRLDAVIEDAGDPLAVEDLEEEHAAALDEGDTGSEAAFLLQRMCNKQLRRHAAPRVLARRQGEAVRRLSLHIVPKNLLGAMWTQLANDLTGKRDFRKCSNCGEWFPISEKSRGKHERYCSSSCRTKAYRERMVEARRLHFSGMSLPEIARKLRTDVDRVAIWVFGTKRGEG
jgi:hypothetical protein